MTAADEVLERLRAHGLVPIVELPHAEAALALADALSAGGLPCVEITFRTAAAVDAMAAISRERPAVLLGAGTVLTPAQVDAAVDAGARFVVSPGFDPEVVARCEERSVVAIPGVLTPTELQRAHARGLRAVKFFPAEPVGGAAYLRSLCGPFSDVRFIPTGGVRLDNLEGYLAIPQVIAVGGSWLAPRSLLTARDHAAIESRTREAVSLVRRLRAGVEGTARE